MYNFKLENFSNSSSSVSKIISQFKLVVTWNQDFDDISTTITLIIILLLSEMQLEEICGFLVPIGSSPYGSRAGVEPKVQKFLVPLWFHWFHFGSILVPFWYSKQKCHR